MTRLLFSLVSVLTLLTVASAQAPWSDLPDCAVPCATDAAGANSCAGNDVRCLCNSQPFIQNTLSCVYLRCPNEDQSPAQGRLGEICANAPAPAPSSSASSTAATPANTPSSSASRPASTPAAPAPSSSTTANTTPTTITPGAGAVAPGTTTGAAAGNTLTVTGMRGANVGTGTSASSTVVVVQTLGSDSGSTDGSGSGPVNLSAGVKIGGGLVGSSLVAVVMGSWLVLGA